MRSPYSVHVFELVTKATAWIAGPVILGTWLGKWLDKRYGTEPWLFLATVGVCFIVSMIGLTIMALREFQVISGSDNKKSGVDDEAAPMPISQPQDRPHNK